MELGKFRWTDSTEFLVVGDPHARLDNLDQIGQLFDLIAKINKPTIILGDLLDTKEIVHATCLNLYVTKMAQLSHIPFIVLVGNHDLCNLFTTENSLTPLSLLPNVRVIDRPMICENLKTAFLPYLHDAGQVRKILTQIPENWTIFGHLDVQGYDFGSGRLSVKGIGLGELQAFDLVVSGHYHGFRKMKNLVYLGTPFTHSFGESDQEKFVMTLKLPIRGNAKYDLIPTQFRQHRTIVADAHNPSLHVPDAHNLYRVILTGTAEELNTYPRLSGVKYVEQPRLADTDSVDVSEALTVSQQFVLWGSEKCGLSDELIEIGLELLEAAGE